jgi:hypothetical protein
VNKDEKIEESPRDEKTGSPGDGKSETSNVKEEMEPVNSETMILPIRESNVNGETKISKSAINKSEIAMVVHHHPHVEKKNLKEYCHRIYFQFICRIKRTVFSNLL